MAHDRSARFGKVTTPTPPIVGPGSYDIYEPFDPPRDLERAYPFMSGTERKTFQVPKDSDSFPGPGSYDPKESKRHVPGGVSIDFTDSRFKRIIHEGPGPEAYELPNDLFKTIKPRLRSHPGTWRGPAGKLWLGAPPRSIITSVNPSVPSKNDMNGYCINENGILVKNPPRKFRSIDFYNVPREESNFVTLRYKGNFWSLMSGRDERMSKEILPGPGAYEFEKPANDGEMIDENFRSMKRATSRQHRYLDELWSRKLLENYPAPNQYDPPKGPFDRALKCECDDYVVEPPAFGHSAERFDTKISNEIPGPGAYDPVEGKCLPCVKMHSPFGAWASRFEKPPSDSRPGPGSYDLTKDDLAKRIFTLCKRGYGRPSVPLRCGGSSGSIRHEDAARCDNSIIVDPVRTKKSRVHHAVFKSTTSRFKDAKVRAETPAPGTYEAMRSFKAIRDPCQLSRRTPTSGFASKTARFPKIPEGLDLDVPGPGIYNLRNEETNFIKGGVVGYSEGCTKPLDKTPGPQKYCLHPYVASSVISRSYNVTLGKPKIIDEQKIPVNPWTRRCRGKRMLRWFSKSHTTYEHCIPRRCD